MCDKKYYVSVEDYQDGEPFEGEIIKRGNRSSCISECYRCNGSGVYYISTAFGAFPGVCWGCNGSKKGYRQLHTGEYWAKFIEREDRAMARRAEAYSRAKEINSIGRFPSLVARSFSKIKRLSEIRQDALGSEFVGTEGERETFTLTLRSQFEHVSEWGPSWNNTLVDQDGNVFVYWGKKLAIKVQKFDENFQEKYIEDVPVKVGDTVSVTCRIKEHKNYNPKFYGKTLKVAVKNTMINRPTVKEQS